MESFMIFLYACIHLSEQKKKLKPTYLPRFFLFFFGGGALASGYSQEYCPYVAKVAAMTPTESLVCLYCQCPLENKPHLGWPFAANAAS